MYSSGGFSAFPHGGSIKRKQGSWFLYANGVFYKPHCIVPAVDGYMGLRWGMHPQDGRRIRLVRYELGDPVG